MLPNHLNYAENNSKILQVALSASYIYEVRVRDQNRFKVADRAQQKTHQG